MGGEREGEKDGGEGGRCSCLEEDVALRDAARLHDHCREGEVRISR